MRYTKRTWMICGLPLLASCALADDATSGKVADPLTLSAATHVDLEGVVDFGSTVFAENPTTLLERGDFHGYELHGKAGGRVTITMTAQRCGELDTLVHLFGPEDVSGNRGEELAVSDDASGQPCNTDSQIADFTLPVDGEYLIVATSFVQRGGGHYALRIACNNGSCAPNADMTFQRSRIAQTDIDHGAFSADALFEIGDFLFEHVFTVDEGLGNNLHGAPAGSAERPNFRTVHQGGFGAPEAQSCITCHNVGGDDGGGDLNHNIFQNGDGVSRSSGLPRNPPIVLGLGLRQQIGIEMTRELQAQLANMKQQAASLNTTLALLPRSKGASFGTIMVHPDGTVDTSGLQGIDPDLVVKPFGWKGREATLRRFVEGGFRVHFGMQSAPSIAKHCAAADPSTFGTGASCRDPDDDGVTDEITEGQLTAMATYMALRQMPVRVPPATDAARARAADGEHLFANIGCANCHITSMQLDSPVHVEPADTTGGAGITFDLADDMKIPRPPRRADGAMTVELWSDFKRHDMGSSLADSKPFKTIAPSQFITPPLWCVATTAPYMHDGRAATLRDAILAHAGEAAGARAAFSGLSADDQQKVVEFLSTLGRADEPVLSQSDNVDVGGFVLSQTSSTTSFRLPATTLVPHGGYVIVARNATREQFEAFYGRTLGANVVFMSSGNKFPLINGSETYSLSNALGAQIEGPTPAQASSGLQLFQRVSGAVPADIRGSWTIESVRPQAASPGSGETSTGNGRIFISEIADAGGTGNSGFEFIELFVE